MDKEPAPLTRRQTEVMGLLGEGLAKKEIAARMGISYWTAKFHVEKAIKKLGATNSHGAVATAFRRGIIR